MQHFLECWEIMFLHHVILLQLIPMRFSLIPAHEYWGLISAIIKCHICLYPFCAQGYLCVCVCVCVRSGQRFSGKANLFQKSYREPKHFSRVTNHPLMQLMRLYCSLYSLITEHESTWMKRAHPFFSFPAVLSFIEVKVEVGLPEHSRTCNKQHLI